jgi:hypothetical protein
MDTWRSSSLRVPAASALGPSATGFFCTVVETGSGMLITFGTRPWLLLTIVLVSVACIGALFISHWGALGAAFGMYRRHLRTLLGIGLVAIPIGIVFNGFVLLVRDYPPMDWVMQWFNDTANARLFAAVTIGGLQQGVMVLVVTPPVIQAIKELQAGRTPSGRECFRSGYRQFWPLAIGFVIVYATAGILVALVIGIPLAIWLSVRWQFCGQAAVLDRAATGRDAVWTSAIAVRGHWWQALGQALVFQMIAVLPGPLIGLLLLLGGKSTVQFANSASSLVYTITLPVSVIGLTLAYERFRERGTYEMVRTGDSGMRVV